MFYFYLCILVSPVFADNNNKTNIGEKFNVRGLADGITYFFTHFTSVMTYIQEIFDIVLNDNNESSQNNSIPYPEEAYLGIQNLTAKHGYPLEVHTVTTADGYILTLHRIPCGNCSATGVIFLMHGLVDTSDSWVLLGPGKALAYLLADSGYDIWLGNARGNKYSMSHKRLQPTEAEFWQFSWEEIGIHDITAMIDYALNVTGAPQLYYIGHSQGTTSFYVMASLKPEYNAKIKMMFSLAPVAWCKNIKSPVVRIFSPAHKIFGFFLSNFNTYSTTTEFFNKLAMSVCSLAPNGCGNLLRLIIGNNHKLVNTTMLPVLFGHIPSSSSTMQFMHYGQLVESERFCRYDYGKMENMEKYGMEYPPDYEMSRITVPVSMFYSGNDWLSDREDVELLIKALPNVTVKNYISLFNHWDYLYADIAKDLVYTKIKEQITLLDQHNAADNNIM